MRSTENHTGEIDKHVRKAALGAVAPVRLCGKQVTYRTKEIETHREPTPPTRHARPSKKATEQNEQKITKPRR